ncbi:MAG: GH3 auxin-responsive promoter family protein, partial [Prevotella sp.]|nr:GH3 auxin-responsive promoter family protein [Prevotella sp.]
MGITSIARFYFHKRQKELERHKKEGVQMQAEVLKSLLVRASDTEYGRDHIFNMTRSYEEFAHNVPVNT